MRILRAWITKRYHPLLNKEVDMEVFRDDSAYPDGIDREKVGEFGEQVAAAYLQGQGYKVLRKNHRANHGGEVDIVCRDRDTLAFVEVKTRTSLKFGRPAEAVTPAKQNLIARGALDWLGLLNQPQVRSRFDVVEVLLWNGKLPEVVLIRNAFELPEPYIN